MNWRDRISVDPQVCHGQPCIKGTRIMVSVILANLADGISKERILANYPSLTAEDIEATQEYGAAKSRETLVKQLSAAAVVANGILLYVIVTTVFQQTHWDDSSYCAFVLITVGTPLLSMLALGMAIFVMRRKF